MTWSELTKKYGGNPLTILPQLPTNKYIINNVCELGISKEIYTIYENVFLGKTEIPGDIKVINRAIYFTEQWITNDNIGSNIDLHGMTKENTLFWLEYQKQNRNLYKYPINIITGRGNHSKVHHKKDIADMLLTGNNSTGILEDLVLNWLKQNHQRHVKYTGNFIIY
jgi:hypothetical protein